MAPPAGMVGLWTKAGMVGKSGDYKSNVLKVNIPRDDLQVKIAGLLRAGSFWFW